MICMKRNHIPMLLLLLLVILSVSFSAFAEGNVQEITVTNTPVKGRILVEKQGLQLTGFDVVKDQNGYEIHRPVYEQRYLKDAVFEIYAAEDIVGKEGTEWFRNGELAARITTSGEAVSRSELLPLGKYTVIESETPYGYAPNDTKYSVELKFLDDQTPIVESQIFVHNEYLPAEISLQKDMEVLHTVKDDDGSIRQEIEIEPGPGFVFGLYNDEEIPHMNGTLPANTLIATAKSDSSGLVYLSGNFPHGNYYLKELSGPEGWELQEEPICFSLYPESYEKNINLIKVEIPVSVVNRLICTPVSLMKTNIGETEFLANTWIELSNSRGEVICAGYTDENGQIADIPLVPDTYKFREVSAPDGYELSLKDYPFYVSDEGRVWGETSFSNDVTRFFVKKVNEKCEALEGTEFGLKDADGKIVMTAVSDENGIATFEKVSVGEYTIVELKPTEGYLMSEVAVPVTVTSTYINPTEPLAVIDNCPNEVTVKKVNQNGAPLSGASFGLFNAGGYQVDAAVTNDEGIARFTRIVNGSYTIREEGAPEGYLMSRENITFTMDRNWKNSDEPIATVVNQQKKITYIKVDTTGKPMPGIEFILIDDKTGLVVEKVISDENGVFTFTKFDYGDWTIRETAAPEGFCCMEDIKLHVDDNWKMPAPVMCVNIPNHYEFVKTDSSGMPLSGVKFSLEDESGTQLGTYETDKEGIIRITNLTPGVYFLKETETLEGYSLSGDIRKIVIDETYSIPETMPKWVNYTVIQTGVNIAVTVIMWVGLGLMAVSITASIIKKKRKHNK